MIRNLLCGSKLHEWINFMNKTFFVIKTMNKKFLLSKIRKHCGFSSFIWLESPVWNRLHEWMNFTNKTFSIVKNRKPCGFSWKESPVWNWLHEWMNFMNKTFSVV